MAFEAGDELRPSNRSASAFWWRLTDNAFRRALWLLVPIVMFGALGVVQAGKALDLYQSTGVLSASSNPLVPAQQIGNTAPEWWETPAVAASRTINEQFRTDAFIENVAERAGLGEAVRRGLVPLEVIRANLWSSADGTSLVFVNARWADPQTTYALVNGAILAYQEFLAETVASQSSEAVDFYQTQLEQYTAEVETAQANLDEFILSLPEEAEGSSRSVAVDLQLNRLTEALSNAEAKVADAEAQIEAAQLAVTQSRSEAGRSLTVIDEPKVPFAPESTMMKQVMTVISFLVLGVVIAFGALLLGTVLDQSVVSASDLRAISGVSLVATVPKLRLPTAHATDRRRDRPPRRPRRATEAREKVGV